MTRQPDLLAGLREIAPEWATRLGYSGGTMFWNQSKAEPWNRFWQSGDGSGCGLSHYELVRESRSISMEKMRADFGNEPWVIDLKTGTIHLQAADGSLIEVPQSEWEKMP